MTIFEWAVLVILIGMWGALYFALKGFDVLSAQLEKIFEALNCPE